MYYVRRLGEDNWRYLFYLLTYLRLDLLNAATGVPGLTRRDAHYVLGAFPKPEEQQEIANVLLLADAARTAAEDKSKAARRLKSSLLQHLFTLGIPGRHSQFKPARFLRHNFEVPEAWNVAPLRQSVEAVEYGTNAASNSDKHGLPIIAIPEVIAARFRLGECSYAEVPEQEALSLRLQPNDVLLIRTNGNSEYIGKSTVIGHEAEDHTLFLLHTSFAFAHSLRS